MKCKVAVAIILAIVFLMSLPFWLEDVGEFSEVYIEFDDRLIEVEVDDSRAALISEYFGERRCPLKDYAETFVEVAEENALDFRLLPAIALAESTGGKFCKGNNPFGFLYRDFESFDEAIRYVGRAIAGKSHHRAWREGMTTEEILWVYNGTVNPEYPAKVMWIMEVIGNAN